LRIYGIIKVGERNEPKVKQLIEMVLKTQPKLRRRERGANLRQGSQGKQQKERGPKKKIQRTNNPKL
jgi:hypothetical protein